MPMQRQPFGERVNRMSKSVFDQISEGLAEAVAVAEGKADAFALHVPDQVDVRAIRHRAGMSQKEFAAAFGFSIDQLKQWEQGRASPVKPLRAYLSLISDNPSGIREALLQTAFDITPAPMAEARKTG